MSMQILTAGDAVLATLNFLRGVSCTVNIPVPNNAHGSPVPGTRGVQGLAAKLVVSVGYFNWFGRSPANYEITITKSAREGYNTGGVSIADAPEIGADEEQYGSVFPAEPGQFYKIHLEPGQLIYVTGQATAGTMYGSLFSIALLDASGTVVKTLANVAPYGTVQFPGTGASPPVFQNTGAAADFYLRAKSQFWMTWDFRFRVETPKLTVTPDPITRGNSATFTLSDVVGAAIDNWTYVAEGIDTIDRITNPESTTWSGKIVAEGTGHVTATWGGVSVTLSVPLTVVPRDWFFQAAAPVERSAGYQVEGCNIALDPKPPQSGGGVISICIRWAGQIEEVNDNGPNHGLKWVVDMTDLTTVDWAMHPDVTNTTSDWYTHQCGNWSPNPGSTCAQPSGTGFISGNDYRDGVARHEAGSQNSHYSFYVAAQNDPANNLKRASEPEIGSVNTDIEDFRQAVDSRLNLRAAAIQTAAAVQPCGQWCSADCSQSNGFVNLPPYTPENACSVPAAVLLFDTARSSK